MRRRLRIDSLEDRVNPSPPVGTPIPRVTVNEDASAQVLHLTDYFSDPDGDPLTYSIVQTNSSGLITPSIGGSDLTLSFAPNGYGYSYMRVSASDGVDSVTTAFDVIVREVNDLNPDTSTTSKSSSVTIDVLANDGGLDTTRLAEAGNVDVVQNDTGNATTSVTVTAPQGTSDFQIRPASNRGDFNVQIGNSGADDVAAGLLLSSERNNGRTNPGDTLSGVRHGTPAIDSDAGGYWISENDSPNGGELNSNVSAAYFPYAQGWVAAWGVNSSGTNGGENNTLRSVTPNTGLTLGTTTDFLLQNLGGGKTRVSIPGVNSQTDGLLLAIHGKNEDNYALGIANPDGSWQINIKDNGSSGTGLEQDPFAFLYLPTGMPNVVSGRIMGDGSVQMASGGFTISKTGTGTYTLSVPGQSPTTGVLILSPESSPAPAKTTLSAMKRRATISSSKRATLSTRLPSRPWKI